MIKKNLLFDKIYHYCKFLVFCYKKFKQSILIEQKKNIIISELTFVKPSIIGILYLLKCLQLKNKCKVIVYYPNIITNNYRFLRAILGSILNFKSLLIFLVSGHKIKFLGPKNDKFSSQINSILDNIKTKEQILNIEINGIHFGDLIYDNYLRKNSKYTININDKNLKKFLRTYLKIIYFWFEFFENYNVKAVNVSHAAYLYAVPMRIAQKYDIPSYIGAINFFEYFDSKRKSLFTSKYRDHFSTLNSAEKDKVISFTKSILEKKFNPNEEKVLYEQGNKFVNSFKLNTFGKIKYKNQLKSDEKPNVIIFSHCFFDAPHNEGIHLFTDYFEWVEYLGKLSNETEYNWYLKKHPHSVEKQLNSDVINYFIKKYPKINLLPADTNNNEILSNKVDLILTVGGSVGYEYSYYGIPVIMAGDKMSYENYDIGYQAKNLEEYNYSIKNFSKLRFSYNKEEIYKYYYNLYLAKYDLLNNYFLHREKHGKSFFDDTIYKIWIKEFDIDHERKKVSEINKFITNKQFNLVTKLI